MGLWSASDRFADVISMAIRVYEYGCGRGQIEGLEPAIDQMRRRTEFWNRLVEIDNDVRGEDGRVVVCRRPRG